MQSFLSTIAHSSRDHGELGKFRPFDYQVFFSCQQTKHDHFDVKQEKVVFISKKDLLREFPLEAKIPL